ncbi:MAG TPA: class I SAM-dependent methyltransferase [Longimicrobium sp.]|nr:class I SAM-dependent methyltransferase [Longimicrobium sp.]
MQLAAHDGETETPALAASPEQVDALNAQFYGAIRFPWPPFYFERLDDPRFWADALDQDVGRSGRPVLPVEGGRIWVAGCGTNQAVITALMFPGARVVGSDVSAGSLEVAERNARQLGIGNLELREESIHQAAYRGEFDYVICTGVIHHMADPPAALARLAAAPRPAGVLQLMVYNRYHRTAITAFQKALRVLRGGGGYDYARELELARGFVHQATVPGEMGELLGEYRDAPDARLADALIQPVEHGYTVETLEAMAAGAGLELLAPCPSAADAAEGSVHWEMELGDPGLQRAYDALPDAQRWQVTNLLLLDDSPMLWFYLQRRDSPVPRRTTRELCDAFLATRFSPARTVRRMHMGGPDGSFRPVADREAPFPVVRGQTDARRVLDALEPDAPLRATLERLGVPTGDLRAVNRLRVLLASSAFPFLRPRGDDAG